MATYRQDRDLTLRAVGRLYEAAASPELWPKAMKSVAHLFDAIFAQVGVLDPRNANMEFFVVHGLNSTPDLVARYTELTVEDPVSVKAMQLANKVMHCGQIADRESIRASRMYREVLAPMGIEYRMAAVIDLKDELVAGLGLGRGPDAPEFHDDDVALMSDILPHFRQSLAIRTTLTAQDSGNRFALAALDSLSVGIAIVDGNSSILFLNKAGQAIIDDTGGIAVRNGHLVAERPEEAGRLIDTVRHVVGAAVASGSTVGEFAVFNRSDGGTPLPATISPLARHDGLPPNIAHTDGLAIVVFTDPDRRLEVPAELLQRLYGLTPAEGRLLAELVAGKSLEDSAKILGVSRETCRKRLAAIFQKTQTNRQAELVRLVLANPVWITEQAKRPALAAGD